MEDFKFFVKNILGSNDKYYPSILNITSDFYSYDIIEKMLENEKFKRYIRIFAVIYILTNYDKDTDSIPIFILNGKYEIYCDRKNFKKILEDSYDLFIENEDYEVCAKIKNLVDRINEEEKK